MVGVSVTEDLIHGSYGEYANFGWNFMKQYSRDLETGEIIYNPYAD